MDSISAEDARRMFLRAQGLLGPIDRKAGVEGVLRRLGCVQLDTISVLARSHELVAYSRLGPVGRPAVEQAYWGEPHQAFEYWAHAAAIVPVEDWPWFEFRRRWYRGHSWWMQAGDQAYTEARARLEDGPVTTADVGGAKKGGEWWDWSEAKIALERMLRWGEVAVVERRGWRRVYDLAERAIPDDIRNQQPPDVECYRVLVQRAVRRLAVGTLADIADYFRMDRQTVGATLEDAGAVPVQVEGWGEPAWADPQALAALGERGRHRTTLLSPFDPIVWYRQRLLRMFGMDHRLEAYTPKPKRALGYFAMPALSGGRLVARVDPKRSGQTLVVQQVTYQRRPTDKVRADVLAAIEEAAHWVGCDSVVLEREVELADVVLWW